MDSYKLIIIIIISATIGLISKVVNTGWFMFLGFPIWVSYIIFFIAVGVFISKKIPDSGSIFLKVIYFLFVLTFILSFFLLPDAGDGDAQMFFGLFKIKARELGNSYFYSICYDLAKINIATGFLAVFLYNKRLKNIFSASKS